MIQPSQTLRLARRYLEGITEYQLLEDWQSDKDRWYLKMQLDIGTEYPNIPQKTDWYLVVEHKYPNGIIKIYPSIDNGIRVTFPHQSQNVNIVENGLWRIGDICTRVQDDLLNEESLDPKERLAYHVRRACLWLHKAGQNKLTSPGDRYELPDFKTMPIPVFAFSEDTTSFMQWDEIDENCGLADISAMHNNSAVICARSFYNKDGSILDVSWGDHIAPQDKETKLESALWIRLQSTPVVNVWQAPTLFGELIEICSQNGVNLMDCLGKYSHHIRDGSRHLLLIGFPIPKCIGDEENNIFWQALWLPRLTLRRDLQNGFRPKPKNYWLMDKLHILKKNMPLEWIRSENWFVDEISERGKMCYEFRRSRTLIIGCGCVGSAVAEMLVRSGVTNIHIVDGDIVSIGNLARHVLSMEDIGKPKAKALQSHLQIINPHARIDSTSGELLMDENSILLNKHDIIIDCTGEKAVLECIENNTFPKETIIFSLSLGLYANILYLSMRRGKQIEYSGFYELITPYIRSDVKSAEEMKLPRDGIGCWHPTFPARSNDIGLLTALVVGLFDDFLVKSKNAYECVLQKEILDDVCMGYRVIEKVQDEQYEVSR